MRAILKRIFLQNWPRKLVALLSAVVIWFLVNQSIMITRTFPDVSIRIINIPPDKTIVGLLPNGLLNRHASVTMTGTKSVISDLRSSDIEVMIDAEGKKESWMAKIDKKSIVNLSSEWDLMKSITDVCGSDVFIKMSRLAVEEIPVTITAPVGDPPKGYQFLNIWPRHFTQRVSGPEEQVLALKKEGLTLTFNLNKITQSDLTSEESSQQKDEISFKVPESWKLVTIPFRDTLEPLNDPRSKNLKIDFLKQEFIPLGEMLPISVFFPLKYSRTLNPESYTLETSALVENRKGLFLLTVPLYVKDVSRLFLDVVRENMVLTLIATPKNVQKKLSWTIEFINEQDLENAFVEASLAAESEKYEEGDELLRTRFREYKRKLIFYTQDERALNLKGELAGNTIILHLSSKT